MSTTCDIESQSNGSNIVYAGHELWRYRTIDINERVGVYAQAYMEKDLANRSEDKPLLLVVRTIWMG